MTKHRTKPDLRNIAGRVGFLAGHILHESDNWFIICLHFDGFLI